MFSSGDHVERQGFCGQFRLKPPTRWKSFAEWPAGEMCYENNRSDDTHETREQALAVCGMLHREGLGGRREIFPMKTRVAEVD